MIVHLVDEIERWIDRVKLFEIDCCSIFIFLKEMRQIEKSWQLCCARKREIINSLTLDCAERIIISVIESFCIQVYY